MKSYVRYLTFLAFAVCLVIVSVTTSPAGPPARDPNETITYYMDSNGDTYIDALDQGLVNDYILFGSAAYDTMQPDNWAQVWNSSDVNADTYLDPLDQGELDWFILNGQSTSVLGGWTILQGTLPSTTGNAPVGMDYQLGVQAAGNGRPSMNVEVTILSWSGTPGDVTLRGRPCDSLLPDCVVSTSISDWYGIINPDPTIALTEDLVAGSPAPQPLGFDAASNGTLVLQARIQAFPWFNIDNGAGLDIIQPFTVVIGTVTGTPPSITNAPAPSPATEDVLYSYTFTAFDADSDPITFQLSAGNTCAGATINSTSGLYEFTPAGDVPPADCIVGVEACDIPDGCGAASDTLIAITPVNDAPTVSTIAPSPAVEDTPYSYDANLSDPDGTGQTWSVLGGDTCGGSIVPATGVYTFTPLGSVPPAGCTINIQVCDAGPLCGSESTGILITPVNDVPLIVLSGCPASVTDPAAINCTITASDPDLTGLTCALSGADTCGGVLTGCTSYSASSVGKAPSCVVGVMVTDSGTPLPALTDTDSATVTVLPPPANLPPTMTSTAPNPGTEQTLYSYSLTANDPEGDPITFQLSAGNDCAGATVLGALYSFTPAGDIPVNCTVGVQACDLTGSGGCGLAQNTPITITPVNDAPTIVLSGCPASVVDPAPINCTITAIDPDLSGITCTLSPADTCAGVLTGCTSYNLASTVGRAPGCKVGVRVTDSGTPLPALMAYASQAITINRPAASAPSWVGTSTTGTLGGVRPVVTRVAKNYPADWGQITLNLGRPITACTPTVTCVGGNPPFTAAAVGNNCVITITAGYWPSNTSCTIGLTSTVPACVGAGCSTTDVIHTSYRCPGGVISTSECSPLGGTCGGFVDTATGGGYGTGTTVSLRAVNKGSFLTGTIQPLIPSNGGYVYTLFEQAYETPLTVSRQEQFDGDTNGLLSYTTSFSEQAKVTIGYKGNPSGACWTPPNAVILPDPGPIGSDNTKDCFQMSTYIDVDARCAVLPAELTTTDYYSNRRRFITGDVTLLSFTNYVGPTPGYGFPAALRFGLIAPVYKNASLLDLNLSAIFQPDDAGRTISVCFGTNGNYGITIGAALPFNILLPDIIRQGATTCTTGYDSLATTTWRYYTFEGGTTQTMMVTIGYANSTLFNFFKGLDITQFPIFIKAFGTHTAVIPAGYAQESTQALGNTIAELDMRDRDLIAPIHFVERGNAAASASGFTTIPAVRTFVVDYQRAKMSALVPPWNQPNQWEASAAGLNWGAQTSRVGGGLFALGGRITPAGASDPGGIVAEQIHMTQKVDVAQFTIFQRGHMNGSGTPPFITYTNDNPFSGSTGNTGNTSERQTGFASTVTDPGGQINWLQVQEALSVSLSRQSVEVYNAGGASTTPITMPGSSLNNLVIGNITDNTAVAMSGFLGMGEVTNPAHDTYYVPPATNNAARPAPINRNGEIYRGTGTPATAGIGAGVLGKKFTLRNPTMDIDATRYPDYFIMYISDPGHVIDTRQGVENMVDLNRLWKFYGNLKGKAGTASYAFTVPYIEVGNRTIGSYTGNVPRPWQGNGNLMSNLKLEWELSDCIIGTKASEGSVLSANYPIFDYQNQQMDWYNRGFRWGSKESAIFFWIP